MAKFPVKRAAVLMVASVAATGIFSACSGNHPESAAATEPAAVIEDSFDGGRFGAVRTYRPSGQISNAALFFSGDGGWTTGVETMARRLASEGFVVAGVDSNKYIAAIQPGANAACTYMAGDMEALSQHLQWKMQMPDYLRPVLFGYSAGSSIVYGSLAESPRGTFAGGVSLSFCSEMDTVAAQLCPGEGLKYTPAASGIAINLVPDPKLSFPWIVVHGDEDDVCTPAQAHHFVAGIPTAKLIELPGYGHDLDPIAAWWPQLRRNYQPMLVHNTAQPKSETPGVSDLPLEEVLATATQSDVFAVLISGDGGWARIDQGVAAGLAGHGIPVVGLNSLKYFWQLRNADSTAVDVARIIEHYGTHWQKKRVLLVGYSFGADVLPFVYNRLREATRAKVVSVSLLGLGPAATYEVTVGQWLPGTDAKGDPTVPEIARMRQVPVLCVAGKGEADSQCPQLEQSGVTVRVIGDGHHFSGLDDEIARAIVAVAGMRTVTAP